MQKEGKVSLEDVNSLKQSQDTLANARCEIAQTEQTIDDLQEEVLHT